MGLRVLLHRCAAGARSCVDLLPSHAADLVLCARMAGPFSRLPSSQPTIKGFVVAYSSTSLQCRGVHERAWSL